MVLTGWRYISFVNETVQLLKEKLHGSIISRNDDGNWPSK